MKLVSALPNMEYAPRKKVWSPTDNLNEKEKENSVRELPIVKLDRQKRGRPTILGAFVDELVCQYVTCFALFGRCSEW